MWHKHLELDSGADCSFNSEPDVWDSEFDDISSLQGETEYIYRLWMKAWGYIHNWKSTQLPLHSHLLGQHVCASVNLLQNARGSEPELQKWGRRGNYRGELEWSEVSPWNVTALIWEVAGPWAGCRSLSSSVRLRIISTFLVRLGSLKRDSRRGAHAFKEPAVNVSLIRANIAI